MLVYPQLGSGALGQYPITKRRRFRTVANRAADSRMLKLEDPAAAITEWRLQYSGLIDGEAEALRQFFAAAEGTLKDFTFLDPTSNLLAWSEILDETVWARGPLLSLMKAVQDPAGGIRASRLTNSGGGPQSILQTLAAPGDYQYCLSAYVRSPNPLTVTLLLGDEQVSRAVTNTWTRVTFAASGPVLAESVNFGMEIPATSAVDIFGLQVEPQPAASGYKPSTTGGVYEHARFHDDDLAMTATGVGLHSCTVNIIHANHL